MKTLLTVLLLLLDIWITGIAGVGANATNDVAPFEPADVTWFSFEDWQRPTHPTAVYAWQADQNPDGTYSLVSGHWHSVNFGYELAIGIHADEVAAIQGVLAAIVDLPGAIGPQAIEPTSVHTWSMNPQWTKPDFCAAMNTRDYQYRSICVFRGTDGVLWAQVFDSIAHYNWYELADDSGVMTAAQNFYH